MTYSNRILPVLLLTSLALPAAAQPWSACTTAANGVKTLSFNVNPSLVVHSDAIMDKTFDDAGLGGGDPGELLFSFKHTIGRILESAQATNTAAGRVAFVQTMLDSFVTGDRLALNQDAGVLVPLDDRPAEQGMSAADLLNPGSASALKPLALFNRFGLAPDNWSHCGEHRIVYGKINPSGPGDPPNRFLLIFEAAVPNPNPGAGEAGCRPIAEFWANLSDPDAGDDLAVAKRLHAFFYEGKTDPSLAAPDLKGPVVDFRNYGGDNNRGQVRGNLFKDSPWQLREWLTQLTFDPARRLAFVRDTVKDNPVAELYKDDLAGTDLLTKNIGAAVAALHGDFSQALATSIRDRLMAEETPKHQALDKDLENFDLGAAPVDEKTILLNTIALGNDNRFNEHQSVSQPPDDDIKLQVGPKLLAMLSHLTTGSSEGLQPQNAEVFLNRAQAGTCAGCHMLSARPNFSLPGATVRIDGNGAPEVVWPDVAVGFFVHVREADRQLSPALENAFLPFRRYVLGRHLCQPAGPVAVAAAGAPMAASASAGIGFVDGMIADFVAAASPQPAGAAPAAASATAGPIAAAEDLPASRRAVLQSMLQERIAAERTAERQLPGAFVETRRPH